MTSVQVEISIVGTGVDKPYDYLQVNIQLNQCATLKKMWVTDKSLTLYYFSFFSFIGFRRVPLLNTSNLVRCVLQQKTMRFEFWYTAD